MTRLYFSRGKHNLVLPAWVLGLLGPLADGRRGIAGDPLLMNTDLRSYIALGGPNSDEEPVVDHKGGIIPIPGSFTLLFGLIIDNKAAYSSEIGDISVDLHDDGYPMATVTWKVNEDILIFNVFANKSDDKDIMMINVIRGLSNHQLIISLLPLDQEGITNVAQLSYDSRNNVVTINEKASIFISEKPLHSVVSELKNGHAGRLISSAKNQNEYSQCAAKAGSWASSFPVGANPSFTIPLGDSVLEEYGDLIDFDDVEYDWEDIMELLPQISTSDKDVDHFFKTSAIILRLLSDVSNNSVTIGPSLQEEMWLPGLVFQLYALDRLGYGEEIVTPTLDKILNQIDNNGVIGKGKQWDAQGAIVLAAIRHYYFTRDQNWIGSKYSILKRVADWVSKQMKKDKPEPLAEGLLPPGSPSWYNPLYWQLDYYYFNNFWGASVFKNMNTIATEIGRHGEAQKFKDDLEEFLEKINDSITKSTEGLEFLPAGPFKRDSSEMIFNLHAFYPLNLYSPTNQLLSGTIEHLWKNYVIDGGVLIDQPWNAFGTYLSILIAQASRYVGISSRVEEVVNFMIQKSSNRQGWAEGISPLTGLGSVGDSPNGYTAAEFVSLILDTFIEESFSGATILLRGVPSSWLIKGIKAENVNLFGGGKGRVEAILIENILELSWDLSNSLAKGKPQIFIPNPPDDLQAHGLTQISNNLYELPSTHGGLKIPYF